MNENYENMKYEIDFLGLANDGATCSRIDCDNFKPAECIQNFRTVRPVD
jgi:hypothetical protein